MATVGGGWLAATNSRSAVEARYVSVALKMVIGDQIAFFRTPDKSSRLSSMQKWISTTFMMQR